MPLFTQRQARRALNLKTRRPGADATRHPAFTTTANPVSLLRSRNLHFDGFRTGLLALGKTHRQHTVLELGANLRVVRVIRHAEAAREAAIGALDAVIALVLLFLLELALAADRQHAVLNGDF